MQPHTRALMAACAFAILSGKKVAGVYDHRSGQRLKIAAECQGDRVQAFDGERGVPFGGTLPELYDAGDKTHVSCMVDGENDSQSIRGHDRHSSSDYTARVTDGVVQLYDYSESAWFAYDIQDPDAARSFHR